MEDSDHPPIPGSGFQGRVSQVNIWNKPVTDTDFDSMAADPDMLVTDGLILRWDNYVAEAGCKVFYPSTVGEDIPPPEGTKHFLLKLA